MLRYATNSDDCAGWVSISPLLYYYQLFNSTALLGGGIYPSGSCDISAAAANAFSPGLRLFGAFDAAMSFVVWLSSTSFCVLRTPRIGRCCFTVSPSLSLEAVEEEDIELEMERGFGLVGCGAQ